MNRRTFLRVLGAAVVGAAVAPSLPALVEASPPSWWASQAGSPGAGAITEEVLRSAFEKCARGGPIGPTYFISTQQAYETYARACGLVYDVEIAA